MSRLLTAATAVLMVAGAAAAGDLTERYQLTLHRVVSGGPPPYSPEFILADVVPRPGRMFTEYSGDLSGRYVEALSASALEFSAAFPSLESLVPRILPLQKEPGYFGAGFNAQKVGMPDAALLWGNGRLLIGLLEYYQLHPKPEVLEAARKIGDFLVRLGPGMNTDDARDRMDSFDYSAGYICWIANLEGIAELYRVTKDERYLKLAGEIAARTVRRPSQHSHGYLSTVRGIVDLYRITGDKKFLDQAELAWRGIIDSGNLLVQGGIAERFAPSIQRTEGCSEADWLRLSLALWRLTGKPEYLENAELTLFNEFALNQFDTGDFGHRVLSTTGITMATSREGGGTARAWWCCTLHGLRGFPDVFASVFRGKDGALWYDLPADGAGRVDAMAVSADSSLRTDATIRLKVTAADARTRPVFIRQPVWASGLDVAVNGRKVPAEARDGYCPLERAWKAGDVITVRYVMRTRALRNEKLGRVALFHGPWLLALDDELTPAYFNDPFRGNQLMLRIAADSSANLEREPAVKPQPFSVPVAHFRVSYSQEAYPMLPPSPATLRPIAEQTGTRSISWQFWFNAQP